MIDNNLISVPFYCLESEPTEENSTKWGNRDG